MPSRTAYEKCPHAIFVRPHMELYEEVSAKAFEVFSHYTPYVEGVSIDEAFLDITGSLHLYSGDRNVAAPSCCGIFVEVKAAGDVEEGLVDRNAFDVGRVVSECLERPGRDLLVEFHVGADEDRMRALLVGRPRGHCGMDAELPRLVGAGGDDAAHVGS